MSLYKGKGSTFEPTNHRDVTLADDDAKNFGMQIREHAYPKLQSRSMPAMYGSGLNGGSTEIAHVHLIAQLEYAETAKLSSATIFTDISTAFATMCKEIDCCLWHSCPSTAGMTEAVVRV